MEWVLWIIGNNKNTSSGNSIKSKILSGRNKWVVWGNTKAPQNELTEFCPVSPYACAKLYAYHMVKTYRQGYGLFLVNGILFNHESPRRGENFVTMKIVNGIKNFVA